MTLEIYKSHLASLDSRAVRYNRRPHSASNTRHEALVLSKQSNRADRTTRFVFNVLVSVVHERIPVCNDGTIMTTCTSPHLVRGSVTVHYKPLSLIWDPSAPGYWSREKALTSSAVSAYMTQEVRKVPTGG